jgi:hypothetical protein
MMWSLFGQNRGFLLQVPRGGAAAKAAVEAEAAGRPYLLPRVKGRPAAEAAGGAAAGPTTNNQQPGEDLQLKPREDLQLKPRWPLRTNVPR